MINGGFEAVNLPDPKTVSPCIDPTTAT